MKPLLPSGCTWDHRRSAIGALVALSLLPAALGAAPPIPWPPCPEPTEGCLERLEARWLREFGSLGLILERPELAQFRITGVVPAGPADGLGIETGDLLIGIGDFHPSKVGQQDESETAQQFLDRFLELRVGRPVRIEIRSSRSGIVQSFQIVPGPARPERARYVLSLALSKWEQEHSRTQKWYHAYRDFLRKRGLPPGGELPDFRQGKRGEPQAAWQPPASASPRGSSPR